MAANREDQAVSIARSALAHLEAFEWPAYSDGEGDAIATVTCWRSSVHG